MRQLGSKEQSKGLRSLLAGDLLGNGWLRPALAGQQTLIINHVSVIGALGV